MNLFGAVQRIKRYLVEDRRYRRAFYFVYFIVLVVFWIVDGGQYSNDMIWLWLLAILIFLPMKGFMKDWWPLLLTPFAYRAMHGFTDLLNENVNITNIISWERGLFGNIPTIILQDWLHLSSELHWYDFMLSLFYSSFYLLPIAAALILWFKKREVFHIFADGFILMTLAGYATYVLFPAMPPWLASQGGYLPEIPRLYAQASQAIFNIDLAATYASMKANLVAAMPSLHAAWPFFIFLCLALAFRWKSLWFAIFPLAIWFGIVYLGEHYVVDAIAGIIYASLAFIISKYLFQKKTNEDEFAS